MRSPWRTYCGNNRSWYFWKWNRFEVYYFLFFLYKQKNYSTNERSIMFDHEIQHGNLGDQRECWPMNQFPNMTHFADPESLEWREDLVLLRKDLTKITISLLVSYPRESMDFFKGNHMPGERKQSGFLGSIGYWFWIDVNSRRPQEALQPSVKVGALWRPCDSLEFWHKYI